MNVVTACEFYCIIFLILVLVQALLEVDVADEELVVTLLVRGGRQMTWETPALYHMKPLEK